MVKAKRIKVQSFFIFVSLATFFLNGCATISSLKPEQIDSVKTITLVIEPYRNKPEILDHTEVRGKSYTGYQFGAIGGLVEGIILSFEANTAQKQSLGGSPKSFLETMKEVQIQKDLEEQIEENLKTGFGVINAKDLQQACQESREGSCGIKEYLQSANQMGAEALVYLKYAYGLATYPDEKASVVIDADLWIYDVSQKKVLLKKGLSSEEFFREGHSVDQFLAEDGSLFKNHIQIASDGLSKQVAAEWFLFTEEVKERKKKFGKDVNFFTRNDIPNESISFFKVSCNYPVKLVKGCSGIWGAVQGIKINNHKAKIAATEDGKTILVMWGNALIMADEIKKIAEENQINILRANTFEGVGGEGSGYILYTDGDLYLALNRYFY